MNKILSIIFLALTIAGCATTNSIVDPRRGHAPQSTAIVSASQQAGTSATSPVLIRIFKQSKELELWRKNSSGKYILVKTYTICTYSGELGPKLKQGDYQSPEGFYTINNSSLNYNSIRFLSVNVGYPNTFDQSYNRSGGDIMIHGGCDSRGCFAVEDGPAQEIFTALRDSFKAGQKTAQIHIFPFRMTNWNMTSYKNNKHLLFWNQLKVGFDKFEANHKELKVSVIDKKYIIN